MEASIMDSLMGFLPSGTESLTIFFKLISVTAEESFMMAFLAIGYWCLDKRFYRDLTVLVCISILLNVLLKTFFQIPRPLTEHLAFVNDLYSFPSGHAQITAVFWLVLAIHYKKTILWWLAGLFVLGQCMSRVYLGVHFPSDVIAGTVVGLITVGIYVLYRNSTYWSLFSRRKGAMALVFAGAIVIYVCSMVNDLNINAIVAMGALIGIIMGHLLENRFCSYTNPESYIAKSVIAAVGMAILLTVQFMLKSFFPPKENMFYLLGMYLLLGFQISYVFPVLVKKYFSINNKWKKRSLSNNG